MMLNVSQVDVSIRGKQLLSKIDFELGQGQLLAIIGPNGAGKSTLLATLAGDLTPQNGTVSLAGRDVGQMDAMALAQCRALLPQFSTLSFDFKVYDIIAMGRAPFDMGVLSPRSIDIIDRAIELAQVQTLCHRHYLNLSGGEAQRVHFARVLAQILDGLEHQPRLLMLDEPTASLDWCFAQHVLQTTQQLTRRHLIGVVVLHDLNLAASFADKIAVIASGELVGFGTPETVLTAEMIGGVFGLDVHILSHPTTFKPLIVPCQQEL